MKKKQTQDSNLSSKDELLSLLREQFNLRMQKGSGAAVKPHLFKKVRRGIARLKTRMHQESASN